jgi:hypothetical protein
MPLIDTTAASNPGVVKRVLAIEDVPEPATATASVPSIAHKCPSCGFTMLAACTYCHSKKEE